MPILFDDADVAHAPAISSVASLLPGHVADPEQFIAPYGKRITRRVVGGTFNITHRVAGKIG